MEQSLHKRVYINPNFKRSEMNPWPAEPSKTTHFNRHYLEVVPKKITNTENSQTVSNNRKIYVNPNFISSNNVAQNNQSRPTGAMHSVNINNVPNKQLLHKSKYSLVQNCQPTNKEQAIMDINKNNAQTVTSELYQNPKKHTQEVPLTRSRYCIVRKKKRLSVSAEYKSVNIATNMVTANQHPIACSNKLTSYMNLHTVKNSEKNKICKTPEKITKIKITKYKTIPISYLKRNTAVDTNKNKFLISPLKPYLKNTTKLSSSFKTLNKNRFRFIKNSTPIKSSSPLSTFKAASKITQHKEKGVLCSGNKVKLLRTPRGKFNINNIPCRLFTKYGKCLRQDQGYCKYLHDKKHVSLCHKFLKGICHDANCTLSHELTDKKMPTCYFYLKGMCTKECCPYLHVKLSDKTKICQEFVKGYCESGDKCLFRHVSITKLKKKRQGSSSSVQRNSQIKATQSKQFKMKKKCIENCDTMKNSVEIMATDDGDCRYYKELLNSDDSYENIKPTRCKLGTLPSFIQL